MRLGLTLTLIETVIMTGSLSPSQGMQVLQDSISIDTSSRTDSLGDVPLRWKLSDPGLSQEFLKRELGMFGITLVDKSIWPPKSPDLNVLDFAIWFKLKKAVKGSTGIPISFLKGHTLCKRSQICTKMCIKKVALTVTLCRRLNKVIAAEGGYFDSRWRNQ